MHTWESKPRDKKKKVDTHTINDEVSHCPAAASDDDDDDDDDVVVHCNRFRIAQIDFDSGDDNDRAGDYSGGDYDGGWDKARDTKNDAALCDLHAAQRVTGGDSRKVWRSEHPKG